MRVFFSLLLKHYNTTNKSKKDPYTPDNGTTLIDKKIVFNIGYKVDRGKLKLLKYKPLTNRVQLLHYKYIIPTISSN